MFLVFSFRELTTKVYLFIRRKRLYNARTYSLCTINFQLTVKKPRMHCTGDKSSLGTTESGVNELTCEFLWLQRPRQQTNREDF